MKTLRNQKNSLNLKSIFFLFLLLIILSGCFAGKQKFKPILPPDKLYGVHFINHYNDAALQKLTTMLPYLAEWGINTIILEVNYGFQYESHPELRQGNEQISVSGARSFTAACSEHGITVIPQFQCLGHQSWAKTTFPLLTKYPQFDLTPGAFPENEGIYCREWDPLNPEVNKIVFELISELISAFDAKQFHVGMDEVFLIGHEKSPATKGKDAGVIFAGVVNELHNFLVKGKGLEMLMWGDRLIDAAVYNYGEWEASANGTAVAIEMIPNDIIICDWHYEQRADYPSIPMFTGKGFRVWPSGWRDAEATKMMIGYATSLRDSRVMGHLFTTWGLTGKTIKDFNALPEGIRHIHNLYAAGQSFALRDIEGTIF